jgi:AraC-like DNA-binding protein
MKLADQRIDPSEVKQNFDEIQVNLHCCRYWKFSAWNFNDLSAPFWRFYYNEVPGAVISFGNVVVEPDHRYCVLIPPQTPFSISTVYNRDIHTGNIMGSRISENDEVEGLDKCKMFDHLFIHFNLGLKFDGYAPGLYPLEVSPNLRQKLLLVRSSLVSNYQNIGFQVLIEVNAILFEALSHIPKENWLINNYDQRIMAAMKTIDQNLHQTISNEYLAGKANLATNSFARLFRENLGLTVQQYVTKRRLEKSLHLLHHTQSKMERIAIDCGFYDIHHFSRVFKKIMNVSPSDYKKKKTME